MFNVYHFCHYLGGYIKNPYNTSGDSNSMSCSDKMTKWNMVGLQGALLSAIIDPIYMDQVILGEAKCN